VGKVGGGDPGPQEGGARLARHVRDPRGRGARLRRRGAPPPREPRQAQFPGGRVVAPAPAGPCGLSAAWLRLGSHLGPLGVPGDGETEGQWPVLGLLEHRNLVAVAQANMLTAPVVAPLLSESNGTGSSGIVE
jgi:hypothetical protein